MTTSVHLSTRQFFIRSVEDVEKISLTSIHHIRKKTHEYRICKIMGPGNTQVIIDVKPFHASGIYAQETGGDHFIAVTADASPILKEITDAMKTKLLPLLRERILLHEPVDKISQSIISGDDRVMKNAFNKKDGDDDGEACFFVKFIENSCLFTFKEDNFIGHEKLTRTTVLPRRGLYKLRLWSRFAFIRPHASAIYDASISYRCAQVAHYPMVEETAPQTLALNLDEFPTPMGDIECFLKSLTAAPVESADLPAIAEIPAKQAKMTDFPVSKGPAVKQKKVKTTIKK